MKERPILFNSEMVKAILDGRKTQTRRPMKINPTGDFAGYSTDLGFGDDYTYAGWWLAGKGNGSPSPSYFKCPYGTIGDKLWVRETFSTWEIGLGCGIYYRATDKEYDGTWIPSIHMPRRYSRIDLEITKISVENIRNITRQDALKEGFLGEYCNLTDICISGPEDKFIDTWKSIYPNTWENNQFVWVVDFMVVK